MSVDELKKILCLLGKKRSELVAVGVMPDEPLIEIFPGASTLYFEPEDGIEMTFSPDDEEFIRLFIILKGVTPSMIEYKGELPKNISMGMKQVDVRENFGIPKENHGPVKTPYPVGWTGGWDCYRCNDDLIFDGELIFKYTADMEVHTLVFRRSV